MEEQKFNVTVSEEAVKRIEAMMIQANLNNKAEVIQRALRLYEFILEYPQASSIEIKDSEGRTLEKASYKIVK